MNSEMTYGVGDPFGFNAYLYKTLYEVILRGSEKLGKTVPDFLIKESISHFEKREQYEKCHTIKSFFDKNPARMLHMSRHDWMNYGWQRVFSH